MTGKVLSKSRSFVVRGLATAGVIAAFALGSFGTQVATTLGLSGLAVITTTPAKADWRRGEGWRRGHWRRGWER